MRSCDLASSWERKEACSWRLGGVPKEEASVLREAGSKAGRPGQQTAVRECMLRLRVLRRWMKAAVVGRRGQDPREVGSGGGCSRERWGRPTEMGGVEVGVGF